MQIIEKAFAKFKKITETCNETTLASANEATTRKRLIDSILEEILGWSKTADINYEERTSEDGETKFADYVIKTPATSLIVEAKRAGITFSVPPNQKTCLLGGVVSETPAGEACRQVRDYCRKKSMPFAVATNGSCWIIFPAVRTDGIPYEKTHAQVFQDLEDIKKRFLDFWNLLSRERVIEGGLESAFFGLKQDFVRRRVLLNLKEPGFRVGRNAVYEKIEPVVSLALTDEALMDDPEGLKFCYVKTSERLKYDSRLRSHFLDVKPNLERHVIRPRRKKTQANHLEKVIETTDIKRPLQFILLLGPVGAGKSTFLEYTKQITSSDLIDKQILWLRVDFKLATTNDNPRNFIYAQILKSIEADSQFDLGAWEKIEKAYAPLIGALRKGVLALVEKADKEAFDKEIASKIMEERKQIEPYVTALLTHFSKANPVFLVVDNVDQIENLEYQKSVFLETQRAAREMRLHAILSLRDATYLQHMQTPVFDAFQVDTIYIDPPQVVPVLSRRFAYAKKFVAGEKAEIVSEGGIRFVVDDLSQFFDILSDSILSEDTGYLLEVLSNHNVRRGLKLVRDFLASGHTSTDKALRLYATEGEFKFSPHEFFKGAIFGQRQYWREEESLIPNIYDSKTNHMSTQLLRFIIVNRLKRLGSSESFTGQSVLSIVTDLNKSGVGANETTSVLQNLLDFGLLQTYGGRDFTDPSAALLATRLGAYIVQELGSRFHYFEPCLIDATILDDKAWDKLSLSTQRVVERTGHTQIELRIDRAKEFLCYLQEAQNKWIEISQKAGLDLLWTENYVRNQLEHSLKQEFERVLASAKRQRESKGNH